MSRIVFLADSGHLKAFRWDENELNHKPRLTLIEALDTNVPNHISEEVTDDAGRYRKGSINVGPSNLSDGEEHNLDLERRKRALKAVASRIREIVHRERPEGCYFAAPSEINRTLLEHIQSNGGVPIEKNVAANLTRLPVQNVIDQFSGAA